MSSIGVPFHLFPGVRYSAPPWNTMEHDRPRFNDPLKFLRPKRAQSALLSTTDGAGSLLDIFILDHFWTHTDPKTTGSELAQNESQWPTRGARVCWGPLDVWKPPNPGGGTPEKSPRIRDSRHLARDTAVFYFRPFWWPGCGPKLAKNGVRRPARGEDWCLQWAASNALPGLDALRSSLMAGPLRSILL